MDAAGFDVGELFKVSHVQVVESIDGKALEKMLSWIVEKVQSIPAAGSQNNRDVTSALQEQVDELRRANDEMRGKLVQSQIQQEELVNEVKEKANKDSVDEATKALEEKVKELEEKIGVLESKGLEPSNENQKSKTDDESSDSSGAPAGVAERLKALEDTSKSLESVANDLRDRVRVLEGKTDDRPRRPTDSSSAPKSDSVPAPPPLPPSLSVRDRIGDGRRVSSDQIGEVVDTVNKMLQNVNRIQNDLKDLRSQTGVGAEGDIPPLQMQISTLRRDVGGLKDLSKQVDELRAAQVVKAMLGEDPRSSSETGSNSISQRVEKVSNFDDVRDVLSDVLDKLRDKAERSSLLNASERLAKVIVEVDNLSAKVAAAATTASEAAAAATVAAASKSDRKANGSTSGDDRVSPAGVTASSSPSPRTLDEMRASIESLKTQVASLTVIVKDGGRDDASVNGGGGSSLAVSHNGGHVSDGSYSAHPPLVGSAVGTLTPLAGASTLAELQGVIEKNLNAMMQQISRLSSTVNDLLRKNVASGGVGGVDSADDAGAKSGNGVGVGAAGGRSTSDRLNVLRKDGSINPKSLITELNLLRDDLNSLSRALPTKADKAGLDAVQESLRRKAEAEDLEPLRDALSTKAEGSALKDLQGSLEQVRLAALMGAV
eukprot:CAMPEP_0175079184 /NCGR_PEP_ID=MMETSP0052_2-20121109/24666_1 /TAXON_ID=51329 ORGANISM="Polytomella parva, Strain SAG 63-3" /NCGR_SAMPLE_ID=MMETSP0052_2 /ASSEMBLY_ACC=CAM_ASM_000194 /LENGTH=658 /DNA_ID=CAMNT_0016349455 /DNA_START=91 /DNA_END=2064 /DNA_ORIENTATION=+